MKAKIKYQLARCSCRLDGADHGTWRMGAPGVVHAWVGRIVLVCNEFKTLFVRPTEGEFGDAPALSAAMAALG